MKKEKVDNQIASTKSLRKWYSLTPFILGVLLGLQGVSFLYFAIIEILALIGLIFISYKNGESTKATIISAVLYIFCFLIVLGLAILISFGNNTA